MLMTSRRDLIRIVTAIIYLSCLLLFAAYSGTTWLLPFGAGARATSLRLVADKPQATVGEKVNIVIAAVSDEGRLDSTRNDSVEVSLNLDSKARLSQSRVNLVRGRAEVALVDDYEEPVVVTVRWISGRSILRGDSTLIRISRRAT